MTIDEPADLIVGVRARQAVRHALQALILTKAQDYRPFWSTAELLGQANLEPELNIKPEILDQYPELHDSESEVSVRNPITQIPGYQQMLNSDVRTILDFAEPSPPAG